MLDIGPKGDRRQVTAKKSGVNKKHPKIRAKTTKVVILP
jgi:hypothetical protein